MTWGVLSRIKHMFSCWSQDADNRTIRAVLTGALQESDGTTYNVATQMNSFVYNTVVGWCAPSRHRSAFADGMLSHTSSCSLGNVHFARRHLDCT